MGIALDVVFLCLSRTCDVFFLLSYAFLRSRDKERNSEGDRNQLSYLYRGSLSLSLYFYLCESIDLYACAHFFKTRFCMAVVLMR